MKPRIFISHRRNDVISDDLLKELLPRLDENFRVMIDERIRSGKDWDKEINRFLDKCNCSIIVLSHSALQSEEVLREITILTKRNHKDQTVELFPVLLADANVEQAVSKLRVTRVNSVQFLDLRSESNPTENILEAVEAWRQSKLRKRNRMLLGIGTLCSAFIVALLLMFINSSLYRAVFPPTLSNYVGIDLGPARFEMGAIENDPYAEEDELPLRNVELTYSYWIKSTEITQGEWREVFDSNPSQFADCGPDCPVTNVSWWDAIAWTNEASRRSGLSQCYTLTNCTGRPGERGYVCESYDFRGLQCNGYRLPTEAEWEYAARGDTRHITYEEDFEVLGKNNARGLDEIAWYGGNSGVNYSYGVDCSTWPESEFPADKCGPQPVATKRPNSFGLYDMLGNVNEWTSETYAKYEDVPLIDPIYLGEGDEVNYHVTRGGAWDWDSRFIRISNRAPERGSGSFRFNGFRIARTNLDEDP